jgi:hypothetical protein
MSKPGGDPSSGISSVDVLIPTEITKKTSQRESRITKKVMGILERRGRASAVRQIMHRLMQQRTDATPSHS